MTLVLVNPDGTGLVRLARTAATDDVDRRLVLAGRQIIAYSKDGNSDPDIFVISPDGSGQRQITFSRGTDIDPTWSRGGSRIAFETNRNGNSDIYSVDSRGRRARSSRRRENELDPAWSSTAT